MILCQPVDVAKKTQTLVGTGGSHPPARKMFFAGEDQ